MSIPFILLYHQFLFVFFIFFNKSKNFIFVKKLFKIRMKRGQVHCCSDNIEIIKDKKRWGSSHVCERERALVGHVILIN